MTTDEGKSQKLRKECRNWLVLPNGHVEIHTGRLGRVVLSKDQSAVWQLMRTEMIKSELALAFKKNSLSGDLDIILASLIEAQVVRMFDEESGFDLLFS